MRRVKRIACWIGFLCACGLLLLASSNALKRIADAHHDASYYFLLSFLVGIAATVTSLVAAYLLEWLLLGWSGSSLEALWKYRASMKLDVLATLVMQLPHRYLDYILSLGLLLALGSSSSKPSSFSIAHFLPWWGLQVGGAILLSSMASYWIHRVQHTIPALWSLHQFHHSADRLAILTAFRDTKLSISIDSLLRTLPLAILSVPIAAQPSRSSPAIALLGIFFLWTVITRLNSLLIHSNLNLSYGWVGRWLLVSPQMHRLHHSPLPIYYNRNFSFDLMLWDRLFGTYATHDAPGPLPVGLDDNPFESDDSITGALRTYFLTTYLEFWRTLRKGWKAWLPVPLQPQRSEPPNSTTA